MLNLSDRRARATAAATTRYGTSTAAGSKGANHTESGNLNENEQFP
jgi:hypothetical protein